MAPKRKLLEFDPNKSDSDDVDFELEAPSRTSRKSVGRSKSKTKSKKRKQKKRRINGSDISDDDVSDSLMEDSFEESEVEEEPEVDSETGRPKRRAKAKRVSYEESGSEESEESHSDDDEEEDDRHLATPSPKKRLVVKLKLPTPKPTTARSTRAGSMARSTRGKSIEAATASGKPRRATRAHTEEAEEFVELSTSGRHAVVRGSTSPQGVLRRKYSNKGIKKPATSVVLEVSHEDVTQDIDAEHDADAADTTGTDVPDVVELLDKVIHDSHSIRDADLTEDELAGETQANETVDSAPAHAKDDEDDDDEDEMPIKRSGRATRASKPEIVEEADDTPVISDIVPEATENTGRRNLRQRKSRSRKRNEDQTSDFEPMEESAEEDISASDASPKKGKNSSNDTDESPRGRGGRRGRGSRRHSSVDEELDMDELAEEAAELKPSSRRRTRINQDPEIVYQPSRRKTKPVDYTIKPMDQIYAQDEDADEPAPSPTRRTGRRGGNSQPWERSLHPTYGPFGGATVGGPWGTGAAGGADSDSSDDENMARPTTGNVPTTPSSAVPPGLLPGLAQTNDPVAAMGGNTLGKIKSQKALADADPLGVDQNVDFSKVGGLAGHIDQLKEMVQMPLLYPELFQKFHVTPPRGVLFHGPPGTGKTLLARALAAQTSSGGRKITFYMRKGADALSKWVGEAERQLRLLFEEARKTQPSIIFFDEIDGLAPVRSSKQEQIHASIVSTLLALMDGMDGRGQVIVIGATNRPDNIDPALRRPGRFDREFYFPLPDVDARRSIIDIHTKDWGIDDRFKDSLAHLTKGYGGADLRALCTEAALNSIQRTYPQIYSSNDKLIVDADKIKVTAKDFMLSVKKMIPSSERATSSGAAPLPKAVEPLLREQLADIEKILDGLLPQKKKVTALQEAMYEQYDDEDHGFGREVLQQEFEQSRVFRPRLLIGGIPGMGQAYLGSALLNHFEGLHVQSFDLPTIFSDSGRSAETAIVQLFAEVKRHKPSVIYLPGVDTWWQTLSDSVLTTFVGLLKNLPPTDPVLVLGICDNEPDKADSNLLANLFSYTRKCRFVIQRPSRTARTDFFENIVEYIRKQPKDFPDPTNRKLRRLETLEVAPPPPPRLPTKEEMKALKQRDHMTLNVLKVLIQPIMDQIQRKYRKFRNPVIPEQTIRYLYEEQDPNRVQSDVPPVAFRPYELDHDKEGNPGLRETASGKFFYNLETTTIEERLSNGYYSRPKDFVADIRTLAKDAKNIGDRERALKANELLTNVEVDVAAIEANAAMADCENVYQRQKQRAKEKEEKYRKKMQGATLLNLTNSGSTGAGAQDGDVFTTQPEQAQRQGGLFSSISTPTTSSKSASHDSPSVSFASNVRVSNGSLESEDVPMTGTDEDHLLDSQNMPPPAMSKLTRNGSGLSGLDTQFSQVSQRSAFQSIPPGMSPDELINDASTTTSGKKTASDPSSRSSGAHSTQRTNGELSQFHSPPNRDSQLPDTQGASQEAWNSQTHVQPLSDSFRSDLGHTSQNTSSGSGGSLRVSNASELPSTAGHTQYSSQSQPSSQKDYVLDEGYLQKLAEDLVAKTSGCTVEQLEQINRELMEKIWQMRGEWNRSLVVTEVMEVFNETIKDIEEMQNILEQSQES